MLRGAEIFLQCLRAEGVDLMFGYPGGAIMPLYDALEGSGIRHVLTRHEQGAVFAAEGHARATGKVGVAVATSGPGATNLVTGIADAKMDSVPLVCITGQVRSALIGTDAFQETDVFGLTLSLTKWSRLVSTLQHSPPFTDLVLSSRRHRITWAWSACMALAQPTWRCTKTICCWFSAQGWTIA